MEERITANKLFTDSNYIRSIIFLKILRMNLESEGVRGSNE